jgi:hypothetical protein
MTSLKVPDATVRWLGFDGPRQVRADLAALARRHSEYYGSGEQVRADITFVLDKPDGWYIHKDARVVLFRERLGANRILQTRIEVEADATDMMVRSVYVGGRRQIATKMAKKRALLEGFELGGQSLDALTVADCLTILGGRSSRPTPPSGDDHTLMSFPRLHSRAQALKNAGYAPLMRFGQFSVAVGEANPANGKTVINAATGGPNTVSFERFETKAEAKAAFYRLSETHRGDPTVRIVTSAGNDIAHRMYQGINPETLALFAQTIGAKEVLHKFYLEALGERSALKRQTERKNVPGYSRDMARVLANFITSNGKHGAGRYYARDINRAIKYIPREQADVQKHAQLLQEYVDGSGDGGASAIAYFMFLGGNVAAAAVNLSQPAMMTFPYLSQWGAGKAGAAMVKALPQALHMMTIADPALRAGLKRARQEGKVDANEMYHLHAVGMQGVAAATAYHLGRLPLAGKHLAAAQEATRARLAAFGTLWFMPFALVEGFNRRLTYICSDLHSKRLDLHSAAFSTRINYDQRRPQTRDSCE